VKICFGILLGDGHRYALEVEATPEVAKGLVLARRREELSAGHGPAFAAGGRVGRTPAAVAQYFCPPSLGHFAGAK